MDIESLQQVLVYIFPTRSHTVRENRRIPKLALVVLGVHYETLNRN